MYIRCNLGGVILSIKAQVIMSEELIQKIDEAAKAMHISRSAYICVAVSEKLKNDLMTAHLMDMVDFMKSYRTSGDLEASPALMAAIKEFDELTALSRKQP